MSRPCGWNFDRCDYGTPCDCDKPAVHPLAAKMAGASHVAVVSVEALELLAESNGGQIDLAIMHLTIPD